MNEQTNNNNDCNQSSDTLSFSKTTTTTTPVHLRQNSWNNNTMKSSKQYSTLNKSSNKTCSSCNTRLISLSSQLKNNAVNDSHIMVRIRFYFHSLGLIFF